MAKSNGKPIGTLQSTVSINGQVTIPKSIRARLKIAYRDTVTFVCTREGEVKLVVKKSSARNPILALPPKPFAALQGKPRLHLRTDEFMRLLRAQDRAKAPTETAPFL